MHQRNHCGFKSYRTGTAINDQIHFSPETVRYMLSCCRTDAAERIGTGSGNRAARCLQQLKRHRMTGNSNANAR